MSDLTIEKTSTEIEKTERLTGMYIGLLNFVQVVSVSCLGVSAQRSTQTVFTIQLRSGQVSSLKFFVPELKADFERITRGGGTSRDPRVK